MHRIACLGMLLLLAGPLTWAQEPTTQPSDTEPAPPDSFLLGVQEGVDDPGLTESTSDTGLSDGIIEPRVLLQAIVSLCIVVALMLVLFVLIRKFGKRIPALAGNNLGQVLGRLYLERGVSLHFVRVGSKVLVVGVTTNAISSLAVLQAREFDGQIVEAAADSNETEETNLNPDAFLEHLRTVANPPEAHEHPISDDEVSRLRTDIQRLQQFLQEEARGRND